MTSARRAVGIWAQWPQGADWPNQGMVRLLGFLIEGIAADGRFVFRVVVPDHVRDAAETDLRTLDAVSGRDYTVHSPGDAGMKDDSWEQVAEFANRHVPVEGWLTMFPWFTYAKLLDAPVTVIFPDAIPTVFHQFGEERWGEGGADVLWQSFVRELLPHAKRAITFSHHVAKDHVSALFGFPESQISVVSHATPDLAGQLFFLQGRQRTLTSLQAAAELLRAHAAERGWEYLRDFPFEEVPYIAISTQDRVTKNLQVAARALDVLLRERRANLKILMTARLHYGEQWAALPPLVSRTQRQFDIVSLSDLPRKEHAAFLHCAAVTVHPSIFEGGHAPFPFYEAVSVGTPCVIAFGPHVAELAETEPEILKYTFDPNDTDALADLISKVLADREGALADQQKVYERLQAHDWASVASAYAETVLSAV